VIEQADLMNDDRSHLERPRIIIVGGSLGGLFAANMLHRLGCAVTVCERVGEALAGRGAGLATHAELFTALEQAGVAREATLGVDIPGRVTVARDGRVIARHDFPQVQTSWGRLYHLLSAALPSGSYRTGRELIGLKQDRNTVSAQFADGSRMEADLLIGADGLRSTVRRLLAPEIAPAYAGYVAWRGLVKEAALSPYSRETIFGYLAFCMPPGEQMLGYPVPGANDTIEPGSRFCNFVWYRPAPPDVLRALLTDDEGRHHPDGIPPHLISRHSVAAMRADAERSLSPQFIEVVRLTEQPFFQPIVDLISPRIIFGRVALLGDAAFVARPHCGMGVTKAGADAMALTRALSAHPTNPERALALYERERARFGRFIVEHARRLGMGLQPARYTAEEERLAAIYSEPANVMRDVSVSPPVPWANEAAPSSL
jgi:2-polyprenyl-6-methoxyphenol hydroxylase-like FAD-dependent oxidoreductase